MSKRGSPPIFKEGDDYLQWKRDLKMWHLISDVPKDLHAVSVHLSLTGRAKNATSEVPYEEITSAKGMDKIFEKLDRVYLQDKDWRSFHAYLNFENYKRADGCAVDEYLSDFDLRVFKLKECGIDLPDAILACRLLKSCSLSEVHFQLALSTCPKLSFENMRDTLKKLFSENSHFLTGTDNSSDFLKVENDVMYTSTRGRTYPRKVNDTRGGNVKREDPRLNPHAPDGSISVCAICSSTMHWAKQCPHAFERQKSDVFATATARGDDCSDEECIEVTLCTAAGACRYNHRLLEETAGMALLDSGCHRTVCGERWLANFTSYLTDKERRSIHIENSSAIYRFGDGEQKKALRCVTFPCRFGGKRVNIKTDVIDSAIPLLMSRQFGGMKPGS